MKSVFLFLVILLFHCSLFAQVLRGKVIDEYQQSIPGANIINALTEQHTHSNARGEFVLENSSVGDTIQVSFIGYGTELVILEDLSTPLTVTLRERVNNLHEIVISSKMDALQIISDIDIQTNPVNSSQDILRKIPGLFIGQHAGGGKAEQIFLRGFDIDHGTDINLSVDGLPVNMVSHAHGQGYADLHFVIPETVDKIDFGKGPYEQDKGNFTTAGYVHFKTKKRLDNSSIKLEAGQFDTYRVLGMFDLLEGKKHSAYVATELLSTDGYFESSQNFQRINVFGKYTGNYSNYGQFGVTLSHFDSKWDASGQVPQRAISSGLISRFGAIDDTEGGATSRSNVLVDYNRIINENSSIKSKIFISQYDFELYSNFTFFLEDSINGDQIKQKESRMIYGLTSDYNRIFSLGGVEGSWQAGISVRNDQSKGNELSHTMNRSETLTPIQFGDINETNLGGYVGSKLEVGKWLFNPSVRVDYFDFQLNDRLDSAYAIADQTQAIVSPKLEILFNPTHHLQVYLKAGRGFHSNDTRVVVANEGKEVLPAATGADLGYIWKPSPKMLLNMAVWYLHLEQEFVYVGDAGIVEPSGQTQRLGVELSYRHQPAEWLFWNLDANYTLASALGEAPGEDYIPLAPNLTIASGLNFAFKSGVVGSVNARHLADRAANEDNSIVAEGYTVVDVNAGYKWNKLSLGVQIQNLLDTEWKEAQFATESRMQGEADPVEEIHFTPGTPFFMKASIQYDF